ncbi:MAG: STAS domain-containing protein [Bacteroidales bacterium]|nr:STAS domain-containing protein [Lachnoclostridium sp.]MCM1383274.1 STAS domain-containing protein [Lachnoclostridium sp.]MCM1465762.1 STAS domain-containing protein [Bacteroidales bacterium]
MKIESQKDGGNLIIKLEGRLETSTAPQLQEIAEKELQDVTDLQIDMEQLEYVSSAGLRVLLFISKKMKAKQGNMSICHVGEDIMEVFEITGFNNILTIR